MCSVVIDRRPGDDWPVLVAANRDEMAGRPWRAPGRHWPDRTDVVAGLDELAAGSWLGVNDHGVLAAVLNRVGTLGPQDGKRSRGELVLEALDHADAAEAADALAALDPRSYRPFNLVILDDQDGFLLCHRDGTGQRPITLQALPLELGMVTGFDPNDPADPRSRRFLPRFASADRPDPAVGDWSAWQGLLADTSHDADTGASGAMCFQLPGGFGTVCSALIALPNRRLPWTEARAVGRFADGPPDRTAWRPLNFGPAP